MHTHSIICLFSCSFCVLFVCSFYISLLLFFALSMVYSFFLSFVHSVIHSLIPLFIQSIFILSVYSFFRLFICYLVHTVSCTQTEQWNEWASNWQRDSLVHSLVCLFCHSLFLLSFVWSYRSVVLYYVIVLITVLQNRTVSVHMLLSDSVFLSHVVSVVHINKSCFYQLCQIVSFSTESYTRFVTVLSLVCVCTLLVVCPFVLFKVIKWASTCKLSGETTT